MGLAIICCITINVTAFASDVSALEDFYDYLKTEESERINEIINSPNSEDYLGVVEENLPLNSEISLIPTCVDCGWFTVSVCAAEATLIGQGYHTGFLGIFQTDCYAYYFVSRGAEMCPTCYDILWEYGEHYCWEIHKTCSKGDYDVCPMQVT